MNLNKVMILGNITRDPEMRTTPAEKANQYLAKGALVLIEGRLQTRTWEGQDGVKRYRTEIIAENMQMGPRLAGAAKATAKNNISREEKMDDLPIIEEETGEIEAKDIPF